MTALPAVFPVPHPHAPVVPDRAVVFIAHCAATASVVARPANVGPRGDQPPAD